MAAKWLQICATVWIRMANEKIQPRLAPIMHAYLQDLVDIGAYGKDKSAVARTLIEAGIRTALADNVIQPRKVAEIADSESD